MLRNISLLRAPLRSLPQALISSSHCLSYSSTGHLSSRVSAVASSSVSSNPSFPATHILYSPFSNSSRRKSEEEYDSNFVYNRDPERPPKLFVVQPRIRPDTLLQAKLSEALNLANSLEEQRDGELSGEYGERELPQHLLVQNPAARSSKAHADTYFGPGTVETVKCHLNAAESEEELDAVFVNTILSGVQQRNLERAWDKPVLDRVGLIIEIFNAHAQTKEAKLQSELAALMYKKTRLVRVRGVDGRLTFGAEGEAEVVSARGRGSGGRGFIGGAGETELQLQRRRILERRNHLLSQIEEVRRTRALQRASRKRRGGLNGQGLVTVAVVGYTNAGKSTLVSALSDSDLYSDDRLFATVDPRLRNVILPSGRKVLLSDTVGFISDLPVQLVEAFHATLEEVVEADLLVHVLDSTAVDLNEQRSTVLEVLQQIGVSEDKLQNMIEVWNKVDLLEKETGADESLGEVEDDEVSSFSAEEDDVASEMLSPNEPIDEDDGASELSSAESPQALGDEQGDGLEILETQDELQGESPEAWKTMSNPGSESQGLQRVETSAITRVGLQELLYLIDEKLKIQKTVTRKIVDRKWRPPRSEDTGAAVEL
ncbi:GTP-binding protein At3g49725, chloroplastic isoform X2 [Telopea speciosissima]|uniref:GTP-binding protein At3g49725, chloroplastic isoform X1 n=1 Tax=Telopea speciosissima TaxID=54955 RepID=UPI001CC4A9E9|nr:GTP-binding protein At3g49725, chloroplastic isoform X1 [Telopea speciosissima]XP_043709734.1 GTP-binding protein At3g49725, chloroplastic isoform X2 [Telopea speciosissima]